MLQKSTGWTRDVLSCRTYGLIVLLSWFANECRSMKATLSVQHLSPGLCTATIDEDFQAALRDAAPSNGETCEQLKDRPTCHHVQELRRSVFAQPCCSAHGTAVCVKLMRLMTVCPCCQTACPRIVEAVAEQVVAGIPQREHWTDEGSAPRRDAGHMWTTISSGGSRAESSSRAWVILVSPQLA